MLKRNERDMGAMTTPQASQNRTATSFHVTKGRSAGATARLISTASRSPRDAMIMRVPISRGCACGRYLVPS